MEQKPEQPKKSYAQTVNEYLEKNQTLDDDVIEYRKEWQKRVVSDINNCIDQARKSSAYFNKDFFVVMRIGMERIGWIPKNWIYSRHTCETPAFGQSQWRYNWKTQSLDFLWAIPQELIYHDMIKRSLELLQDPETAEQTKQCLMMASGELERWARAQDKGKPGYIIQVAH